MKIDNRTWARGRRVLMASLVTLAAAGVLAADQAAAQDVKRGGTLVIARPEEPLSWNPYTQGDNGSIYAIEQVCDSLVEADADGPRPAARLGRILGDVGRRPFLHLQAARGEVQRRRRR